TLTGLETVPGFGSMLHDTASTFARLGPLSCRRLMNGVGPGLPVTATPWLPSDPTWKAEGSPHPATSAARRTAAVPRRVFTQRRNPCSPGELSGLQPDERRRRHVHGDHRRAHRARDDGLHARCTAAHSSLPLRC